MTRAHMIPAKELNIVWGDSPQYWAWKSVPESIYVVAELLDVCWLAFTGKVKTSLFTPNSKYGAYLVFKLKSDHKGINQPPVQASVGIVGGEKVTKSVMVVNEGDGPRPVMRYDGWLEVEMGEYYVKGDDGELEIHYEQTASNHWKSGLVVAGIEIRAK